MIQGTLPLPAKSSPKSKKSYGYVYRTTNLKNGKTYIGQHRHKPGEKWTEYLGSGKIIARAIAKHGKEAFKKELLATAASKEELNFLEVQLIRSEVEAGRAHYNIMVSDPGKINWMALSTANAAQVLDWYFEDLLSTREIADLLNCSQPVVIALLSEHRDDPRFDRVRERVALRKRLRSKESLEKARTTCAAIGPQTCKKCGKDFGLWQVRTHEKTCGEREARLPTCPVCEKRLTKMSAKTCRKHRPTA